MLNKMYRAMKRKNHKGFSLVELIIVIAIMAILIAILAPQFIKYVERSRVSKDEAAADEVLRAVTAALATEDGYKEVEAGDTFVYTASEITGNLTGAGAADPVIIQEIADTLGGTASGNKVTKVPAFVSQLHRGDTYIVRIKAGYGGSLNAVGSTKGSDGKWVAPTS